MLRVLQGIGVGGEYGGAVLLAVEYAPAERRGFFGSFAHIGVPGGLLLASGAFSLASLLPDEAFLAWGWRACFLLSVVLLAVGAYIRLSVMETPAFAKVQERKEVSRSRCATCSPSSRGRCCSAWAPATSRASPSTCSRSTCWPTPSPTSSCPSRLALNGDHGRRRAGRGAGAVAGALSDRLGRKPVYRVGAWLGAALRLPGRRADAVRRTAGGLRCLRRRPGLLYGVGLRPARGVLVELFDTPYRYTALSTVYQVSGILASGLTPLIAAWLVTRGDGTLWWVAGYNVLVAAISLASALPARDPRPDLDEVTPPRSRDAVLAGA